MALSKISGAVSGLRQSSETTGHMGPKSGAVFTAQLLTLRVGGKPVEIKLPSIPSLEDGEQVTAVGREKAGTLRALALRNDATGAVYTQPTIPSYITGVLLLILGIPLSFVIVGLPFLAFGIVNLYQAYSRTQAANLLRAG